MKTLLTFILLAFSFNSFSQTQAEMNLQAYDAYATSDELLNEIYQTILSEYQSDVIFLENLKSSQRLWVQFRDAELAMKYPEYPYNKYGSMHPACRASYLKELTDQRIVTLQEWVSGLETGEGCNGSVKALEEIYPEMMMKASIDKNGLVWLQANMKKDHRIFGYKDANISTEKMILISIFTNEVKNNPFACKYGAYYDTSDMSDMKLKYISSENDFLKIAILENNVILDEVYMLKKYFEFEE